MVRSTVPASHSSRDLFPYALLIAATFVAYANIYGNGFLYDDESLIVHNALLRHGGSLANLFLTSLNAGNNLDSGYYRPLQSLLYMVVFHLSGAAPIGFHLLNVALHAANAGLVYRLGVKLKFRPVPALFAALLWAAHPIQTEAVTYMSATADPLYSLFCLLGVTVLLPDITPRRTLAACGLMMLGLLSKEAALCLPLLAMGSIYLTSDQRSKARAYVRLWPLWVIAAGYIGLRMMFSAHGAGEAAQVAPYAPDDAMFTTLPDYVRMLIWPSNLHMGHDLPHYPTMWQAKVMGGIALGLLAMTQILRRQSPRSLPFSWGLGWFFAALLPAVSVAGIFYEHWLYLPSAGLFLGIAQSLAIQSDRLRLLLARRIALGGMVAGLGAILLAGSLTYRQNMVWHDPMVFYAHIFAQGELAAKAHVNLGVVYAQQGDYDKAIAQYQIAIRNSDDGLAEAQSNWAATLRLMPQSPDYARAIIQHFERALTIDPNFYPALSGLAQFYSERGDAANAARYQARADALRVRFHAE